MDGKILKVIGFLVQAANTGAASALNMAGDADLAQAVVNPVMGKASLSKRRDSGYRNQWSLVMTRRHFCLRNIRRLYARDD